MELLILVLVIGAVVLVVRTVNRNRERQALESRRAADLVEVRKVADEDVTRFGEDLQRLDTDVLTAELDDAGRQDYQRALDSYESAKESLARVTDPDDVRHVTEALEDGRYAAACVRARVDGRPLPTRRPPCFFNPAHGPSTTDVQWSPPGGEERQVPVCAADADRLAQGADPDVRTVRQGVGRVPYWEAGPAYGSWASGYFSGYATSGLVPAFLLSTMLMPGWGGYGGGWDGDGGYDGSGDGGDNGGDGGYDGGGDSGDGGGYDGGGDAGGGWDPGGWDLGGGGGDFGGGDFGGGDFGGF